MEPTASLTVLKKRFRRIESVSLTVQSEIAGKAEMTFNFDGRVLSIGLCGAVHEVVASGESWPCSYQITVSSKTRLPPRFTSSTVEVNVFEDYLRLDRLRLGPCEAAA